MSNTFSSNVITTQVNWGSEFQPLNSLVKNFGIYIVLVVPIHTPKMGRLRDATITLLRRVFHF